MSEGLKPSDRIMDIMRQDTVIPKGYQADAMDYIRYIMQYLDEQHSTPEKGER